MSEGILLKATTCIIATAGNSKKIWIQKWEEVMATAEKPTSSSRSANET